MAEVQSDMKLATLRPRLSTMSASRVQTLNFVRPGVVERKRGSAGVKDRESIKQRDCGVCQSCGRLGRVVDHIVPLWAGGSDDESNKQLLCDPCHDRKTKREATQRAGGGQFFRNNNAWTPRPLSFGQKIPYFKLNSNGRRER